MAISEMSLYDFFKEKIKLSDSEARQCVKECVLAEEKRRAALITVNIETDTSTNDTSRKYFLEMEDRVERSFRQFIFVIVAALITLGAFGIVIIKLSKGG